jgi:ATP-dependent DNA helicase RecG
VAEGTVDILVGTHALIQEDVKFKSLSLAITDEQHRFGVLQRSTVREKGKEVDTLVMTATPIPRSLSLTLYGDLDLSLLDEMPPGRIPIDTRLSVESEDTEERELLLNELKKGRQGYVVFPLVEETERSDLEAAVQSMERLRTEFYPHRVGLLHGRMKSEEKENVMDCFHRGEIELLVTTVVVEVGVDVPNATVIWIERADRYGLAQLHQLRGRVGRGSHKSYCILRASLPLTEGAEARLSVMVETNDGFVISDRDLEIRGAGEVFGTRQAGIPDQRLASLIRHTNLLTQAREDAFELVDSDPELSRPRHWRLKQWVGERWGERLDLGSVG